MGIETQSNKHKSCPFPRKTTYSRSISHVPYRYSDMQSRRNYRCWFGIDGLTLFVGNSKKYYFDHTTSHDDIVHEFSFAIGPRLSEFSLVEVAIYWSHLILVPLYYVLAHQCQEIAADTAHFQSLSYRPIVAVFILYKQVRSHSQRISSYCLESITEGNERSRRASMRCCSFPFSAYAIPQSHDRYSDGTKRRAVGPTNKAEHLADSMNKGS